ncbi:glutamyl aminopeptidase-like isoform X2 [Ischnura elegans]|uniref:glutamyl aminopeptidase-like isoform X2 n=1 Tax=Ischnura elegans TaxID=197161 RepID=UPI001ED895B4|nr:glutamyl aminopeptidase-like isoform X2 [Ischnura elegans]
MSDQEVDDVAFLTGESQSGGLHNKRGLYSHGDGNSVGIVGSVAVCSQKRALAIATVVFASLFTISLIIAYAGPQNECPCIANEGNGSLQGAGPSTTTPTTPTGEPCPWSNLRLPHTLHPIRYNITIHPNLTTLHVKGQVTIEFAVDEDTNFIVFHAKNLTITDKSMLDGHGRQMNITRFLECPSLQQVYVEVEEAEGAHLTPDTPEDQQGSGGDGSGGKSTTNGAEGTTKKKANSKKRKKGSKNHTDESSKKVTSTPPPSTTGDKKRQPLRRTGGVYVLALRYSYRLSRELEGFYLSSYVDGSGEKRFLATTHFEPTYARSAFPCLDEPHLKAKFKLSVFRDRFHIALANMPVEATEDAGFYMGTGLLRDDFQESVKMSTYLVAWVVCDYKSVSKQTARGISVSVYAPQHHLHRADFALSLAANLTAYFEEFFGLPYPLPKQDLIAIPDFSAGAMENWGLITYRETSILYDPNETSSAAHQWVAIVVAHELAHQWFGNLVTMRWWNDLWLNEGFASFAESVGVSWACPDWGVADQFVVDKTQPALRLDALPSSHPISVGGREDGNGDGDDGVKDPSQIEAIFDTISYSKGAAILRMMEDFVGEETLRAGLSHYLHTYAFGNADTDDLWTSLSLSANHTINVKAIMDTWTRQMGYPLVTITREGRRKFRATQKRFLLSPNSPNTPSYPFTSSSANFSTITMTIAHTTPTPHEVINSPFGYKWYIPLTFHTDLDPGAPNLVWMNMTGVSIKVPVPGMPEEEEEVVTEGATTTVPSEEEDKHEVKWLKANVDQQGFYRVMYEPQELWDSLVNAILKDHTSFAPADRASVLDDAFTLCRAGLVNATLPLRLSMYLMKERDLVPWSTALEHLQSWSRRLSAAAPYRLFCRFVRTLLAPTAQALGWEDKGLHITRLVRSEVLTSAVLAGVETAVEEAKQRFKAWMDRGQRVPPNLREAVYAAGIKYGGYKEWLYCWNRYNTTTVPSEQKLLLRAMGMASDPWILQRYLLATLDRDRVKPQDVKGALGVVAAASPEGQFLAWRHLRAHWNQLRDLFGGEEEGVDVFEEGTSADGVPLAGTPMPRQQTLLPTSPHPPPAAPFALGGLVSTVVSNFATEYDYREVSLFFEGMDLGGGRRSVEQSLETIRLNAQWVARSEEDILNWLEEHFDSSDRSRGR